MAVAVAAAAVSNMLGAAGPTDIEAKGPEAMSPPASSESANSSHDHVVKSI